MTTKRRPAPAAPALSELLAAIQKVDRAVLDFQKTTSGTLERLLPMTNEVREKLDALSSRLGRMEHEIEAVKRRVFALEHAVPPQMEVPHADAG